jgi:hypothetical protein
MSVFARMLPYLEQAQVFSAIGTSYSVFDPPNLTVDGIGIATLWCLSDSTVQTPVNLSGAYQPGRGARSSAPMPTDRRAPGATFRRCAGGQLGR